MSALSLLVLPQTSHFHSLLPLSSTDKLIDWAINSSRSRKGFVSSGFTDYWGYLWIGQYIKIETAYIFHNVNYLQPKKVS
jgi:hypothetical protein